MLLRWPHDSNVQVMGAPGLYTQDAVGYSQGSGTWKLVDQVNIPGCYILLNALNAGTTGI